MQQPQYSYIFISWCNWVMVLSKFSSKILKTLNNLIVDWKFFVSKLILLLATFIGLLGYRRILCYIMYKWMKNVFFCSKKIRGWSMCSTHAAAFSTYPANSFSVFCPNSENNSAQVSDSDVELWTKLCEIAQDSESFFFGKISERTLEFRNEFDLNLQKEN